MSDVCRAHPDAAIKTLMRKSVTMPSGKSTFHLRSLRFSCRRQDVGGAGRVGERITTEIAEMIHVYLKTVWRLGALARSQTESETSGERMLLAPSWTFNSHRFRLYIRRTHRRSSRCIISRRLAKRGRWSPFCEMFFVEIDKSVNRSRVDEADVFLSRSFKAASNERVACANANVAVTGRSFPISRFIHLFTG